MAQDMRKGRRTEIQLMNGYIAEKGKLVGIPTPTHEQITDIVTRVERGELKPGAALLAS
jgi:2-dehydropantoate 2-reductase